MDRRLLLCTTMHVGAVLALALPAHAQPAPNARPTGGSVVAGSATIAQSATTTTIDQTTQRAAINWQSFNIGSQQTVQFEQPSSNAVALNRVVGPNPSEIAGRIDANGQVIITNQSGVVFYKGSQVNTAGLMVSAAGIGNSNFMAGRMVFDQAAKPNAAVVNQGSITVKQAGLAALVAPRVANSGVIDARLGHVVLAGAEKATLDLYGDGLMAIDVTGQVVRAPNGATALVTNTGVIRADGGTVQLTAQAADDVVQTLVNAGGRLQANTVGNRSGSVVLNGVGGSITVAGQLTATGATPGTAGGNIEVDAGASVTLASTARINASGQTGGGVVAIGTTLARARGGPGVTATQTAANTTMAAGATIAANATGKGNGGRVAVLSGGTTVLNGAISAKGGPNGGNGGKVETSGHSLTVGTSATVDTLAPRGETGNWLLDPIDVDIAISGGTETPTTVIDSLIKTDVTIAADNDITVTDAIDATTNKGATHSLTLEAGRTILLKSSITMNGGSFTAIANDSSLNGGAGLANRGAGPGDFSMVLGTTVNTSKGPAEIQISVGATAANPAAGGGAFTQGAITLVNLTSSGAQIFVGGGTGIRLNGAIAAGTAGVSLNTQGVNGITLDGPTTAGRLLLIAPNGGVTQDAAGGITASELGVESAGSVDLLAANAVTTLAASVTNSLAGFAFRNDSTPLTVGGVDFNPDSGKFLVDGITTNNGPVALSTTASGDLTVNSFIRSSGGEIDIAVAPGSGFTNNTDSTLTTPTSISSGGGNVVVLADSMTLAKNSTINAGDGTIVLGPATTTNSIVLGAASSAGILGLQTSDLATMTAGMIEVGYRAEDASASFTGGISIGGTAGISVNPTNIPALLLVTGGTTGTVSQTEPLTFSATGGTLGIIAGGNVTLTEGNQVLRLAGYADNGSAFAYSNVGQLTVATLTAQQLGVAVDATTGIVSTAPMAGPGGNPSNPLSGVTAIGGGGITLATTTGDLHLNADVSASGQTVTLNADGQIFQDSGAITAGTLTGSSVHGATMTQDNAVNILGPFTDAASDGTNGLTFTNGQAFQTTGTVKSDGQITLTTTLGGITLDGNVTAIGQVVTLNSAATISQPNGIITAATVTGGSAGGANMTQGNLVGLLGPFADMDAGSTGIAFTDAQTLGTTGTVSSASGPITLTTTGKGSNLTLGGAVTASVNTVTLSSAGTIGQTTGVITAATLTGGSTGGTTLTLGNLVTTLGPFADTGPGSTGIAFTDAKTLGTTGTISSASGPIILTTTGLGSNLTLGGAVTASGNTVTLDSAGTIDQTSGAITAATLTGNSTGGASLTDGNLVTSLGTFTDTGAGSAGIAFTDSQTLGTTGTVSSVSGPVTLTTTGKGSNLTLGAAVTASVNMVTLDSAGTVGQTAGVITAAALTGNSVGGATLTLGNLVTSLGPFADTGSGSTGIAFTDAETLGTSGTIKSASGPITLTTTVPTITGPASNLTLGGDVTASGNVVTLDVAGTIGQTAGAITAATLTGNSVGGTSLTQGNLVTSFGGFTDTGAGSTGISFTDARALGTTGTISSASGPITLTTTGTGSNLSLGGALIALGNTVTLDSSGTIGQTGGSITAATLTGQSVGGATLTVGIAIDTLGPFSDTGAGNTTGLSVTDGQALQTTGLVSSTGPLSLTTTKGALTLGGDVTASGQVVTLTSAATIDQTDGAITAGTLTGSSIGGASLTQGNLVISLGPFTDTGVGSTGIAFTDARTLGTIGTVSSASGPVTLTTTLAGSNLTLGADVAASTGTVTLDAAGTIDQTAGVVTAATLTGDSVGGASLAQANRVTSLDTFTDTGAGSAGIAFTDAQTLATTGTVSSASGPVTLTTTGAGSNLTLGAPVIAAVNTVTLDSEGTIGQTSGTIVAGTITAAVLSGKSVGGTTLTLGNLVTSLGPFTDTGPGSTGIDFTNAEALGTSGTVSSASGPITLTTTTPTITGPASNLTLGGDVTASGNVVTLDSAGTIGQTAGAITAATLTGNSVGGASLTQGNLVISLGTFTDTGTGSTGIAFTDARTLGTTGTVSSASGPVTLTTTGAGSNLTLGAAVTAGGDTVTLDSAGTIGQTAGVITAATLTGTSVGGADLTQGNLVTSLGTFTDTGAGSTGIAFTDAQALGTTGTVSSVTGPITLTTTGGGSNLTLGAAVTAGVNTVALDSAGTIDQTAGVITAATLTGNSVGGTSLTQGNLVASLGTLTDTGAGSNGIAFTDAQALGTSGTVSSASGPITLTTTGGGSNLTLGAAVTASGNTVTLGSAGTIDQTGGVITAATLTGASVGGASLTLGNLVTSLGTFIDTGAGSTGIAFTDAQALGTTGTVTSASGPVALATTGAGSNLTLGGDVISTGNTVTLDSAGTIDQTVGAIDAATLTGNSVGGATLFQGNAIGTLGSFSNTGGGNLQLLDAVALTISGPVASDLLTIVATGKMTLAGNIATIGMPLAQQSGQFPATGGSTLVVRPGPTTAGSASRFVQTGTSILSDPPGTTLRIQLEQIEGSPASATFNNLEGPGAELVLALGTGTATGTMEVGGLLVLGQRGSATLVGSIDGVTTRLAAALGQITPAIDPNYTFNDCTIGLLACGAPTPPLLPPGVGPVIFFSGPGLPPVPALPLLDLTVLVTQPLLTGELAPVDVVPPNISFEDY